MDKNRSSVEDTTIKIKGGIGIQDTTGSSSIKNVNIESDGAGIGLVFGNPPPEVIRQAVTSNPEKIEKSWHDEALGKIMIGILISVLGTGTIYILAKVFS